MAKLTIELGATIGKLKRGLSNARSELSNWSKRVAKLGKVAIGVGVGALAAGLAAVTKRAVELAAKFQQTQVAFRAMVGDSREAAKLIDALTEFSTKTPFSPEKVQDAAKTLLSFGFTVEEVRKSLKPLGDVAAGTGKDFKELAVIYGQVKSAGRLMGQDLLQLINAGFNPLQVISERTGKSVAQLKDEMSKGLITFDQVEQAFIDATSAGGLFNDMMEQQSKTVGGLVSTVKGNFDEFLKTVAAGTTGPLTDMLNKLNDIALAMTEVVKAGEEVGNGISANIVDPISGAKHEVNALTLAYKIGRLEIESQAPTWKEIEEAAKSIRESQEGTAKKQKESAGFIIADEFGERTSAEDAAANKALRGLSAQIADDMSDLEAESNKVLMGLGGPPDPRAGQAAALREGIAFNQERARELEASISAAFRPQGEIASSLSRIGGERGIAVSRNIPEKQLKELEGIRKGVEIMENTLKNLNPTFPG